jgi:AcrR family transcriptional regulator
MRDQRVERTQRRAARRAEREARRAGRRARRDAATRQRLLDVATQLFSADGFQRVTVRDIASAARANVAAVNYYFGDKLGLYQEIIHGAAVIVRRMDPTLQAPPGSSPEARIRHYVTTWLPRAARPEGPAVWVQRLMAHEMQDPTPLAPWIAEQVILPRIRYLSDAVAELLGCPVSDPRVVRCVISLQAQCLFYLPSRFRRAALAKWDKAMLNDLTHAAQHIVEFSLAGIARLADAFGPSTR